MATATVVDAVPCGHHDGFVHAAGLVHAAPSWAAGAKPTAAADIEPVGHGPAGQRDGSAQADADAGCADA